jgi:ABC-2 type transport system permease protein
MGFMFFNYLSAFNQMNMQYQQMNVGKPISITDGILRPVYGNMNVIFLFLAPFITMRVFAEERKNQTLQLLMTSPVSVWEMVLGKFLSALLMVIVMLAVTGVYPALLFMTANPDPGAVLASYLGTFLMAAAVLSLGVLFSSMTENQIVAGSVTFAASLFLWLINWASQVAGSVLGEVLTYLSMIHHFNNLSQGLISTPDLIFFLSLTYLCLFLTHRVLDSYRWRQS